MKSYEQDKRSFERDESYRFCDRCLEESRFQKSRDSQIQEIYEPIVRLPLYIYPAKEKPVLMGYVDKCLRCQQNYYFKWIPVPERYSSESIRQALIKENEKKYTKGLNEAELCSPRVFEVKNEDADLVSYMMRFNSLLKQYAR